MYFISQCFFTSRFPNKLNIFLRTTLFSPNYQKISISWFTVREKNNTSANDQLGYVSCSLPLRLNPDCLPQLRNSLRKSHHLPLTGPYADKVNHVGSIISLWDRTQPSLNGWCILFSKLTSCPRRVFYSLLLNKGGRLRIWQKYLGKLHYIFWRSASLFKTF